MGGSQGEVEGVLRAERRKRKFKEKGVKGKGRWKGRERIAKGNGGK